MGEAIGLSGPQPVSGEIPSVVRPVVEVRVVPDALVVGAANHHADPSVHRVTAEGVLDGVILLKTRRQRAGRGEPGTKLAAEAPAQRLKHGTGRHAC